MKEAKCQYNIFFHRLLFLMFKASKFHTHMTIEVCFFKVFQTREEKSAALLSI